MSMDSQKISREIVALICRYFILTSEEGQAERSSLERARAGLKLLTDVESFDPSILSHFRNAERFSDEDTHTMDIVSRVRNLIDQNEGLANDLKRLLEENGFKESVNPSEGDFSGDGTDTGLSPDRRGMSEAIEAWRKSTAKLSLPEYLSTLDGRHDR